MPIIKIQEFYPFSTDNESVDVSEAVEAELLASKREQKNYERRMRYNKVYSLDAGDGIETAAIRHAPSPEDVVIQMERDYHLYEAMKSLSEKQESRIRAHYLLGMKQREIAEAEGVSTGFISSSVHGGLRSLPKLYRKIESGGYFVHSK